MIGATPAEMKGRLVPLRICRFKAGKDHLLLRQRLKLAKVKLVKVELAKVKLCGKPGMHM